MKKKIKILHLEDSLKDSELICSLINSGEIAHDYFLADNEKDFKNILETENIDIILSDYSLPDYNGNEALKFAREKYSHIPFIFVSGAMGEDAAINAMLNGATDYVLKNKLERLVPAIKRAMNEYELEIKRKQAEINLKEKNELIEAQNEKYILINKELEKAKEKAEESDRLKSVFLTNLSHELRTPLNSILGFSQLITGVDDRQQIMDFAKIINKGGNHLLTIVEDLFIVSAILSENIKKEIKPIHINNLLDKARFIINDEILKSDKKDLSFSIFDGVTEDKVAVMADYDMFGEIIRKLIRNAIMFTSNGKIEVGFRIETLTDQSLPKGMNLAGSSHELQENKPNLQIPNENGLKGNKKPEENIIFYVSDTGIGIPKEKQEIIFDFFRQVEESAIKKFGGIGSGLAICNSFVGKMNGTIWVESELGKGSTFYFALPIVVKLPDKQISPVRGVKDELKIDFSNKTFLVVDDAESNRLYLNFVLKNKGSNILEAENGKIALELVKNKNTKSIDLILMDLNMPVMDGYEATRMIKKIHPEIPIIVQTAYALPEHRENALNSGCDAFIVKPINSNELIKLITECLIKSRTS